MSALSRPHDVEPTGAPSSELVERSEPVAQPEPWASESRALARPQAPPRPRALSRVGRYILHPAIARGGMATVHAARLVAAEGVTRLVAAKRLHPHFIDDPEFVAMFHDEARIASRIHHPNVVPVLDVVRCNDEVILVQEYVHGVPLSHLFKLGLGGEPMPIPIAAAAVAGILAGLHAAHEATDEMGEPLGVVHRDVSPQNVILSVDGIPRLVDFGIAKAKTSTHHTREGFFKGKLAYMAPEQIRAEPVSRRTDIYAAGVLLWELVVNRRFYEGKNDADFVRAVAVGATPSLMEALESERDDIPDHRWEAILKLERVVNRAMAATEADRYPTALVMASELIAAVGIASTSEVASWVRKVGAEYLTERQRVLAANEEVYRASVSNLRAALAVGTRGGPAHGDSIAPPSPDGEEPVRSSGPRIRPGHDGARHAMPEDEPSHRPKAMGETQPLLTLDTIDTLDKVRDRTPRVAQTFSLGPFRIDSQISATALAPYAVIAVLLVVVGVLLGIVISRPSTPTDNANASTNLQNGLQQPAAGAVFDAPAPTAEADPPAVAPPIVARPAPSLSVAPPATQPPPPQAATMPALRFIPRAPLPANRGPVSTGAASTSARHDCTPPFYFEGNKKIFKPNCL